MVDAPADPRDAAAVPTIAALFAAYRARTGHSYQEMARRLRDEITAQQLQKIAAEPVRQFPKSARTIALLSELLDVSPATIVLAYAATIGVPIRPAGTMLEVTLPPGTDDLTVEDRVAIRAITRQLIDARRSGTPPLPDYTDVDDIRLAPDDHTNPTPPGVATPRSRLRRGVS